MCGVCGVFNHPDAAFLAYLMTFKHQHRGQESAGVAVINGSGINVKKGLGYVADVFDRGRYFSDSAEFQLKGNAAIGHVRYSTSGEHSIRNAQPFSQNSIESELGIGDEIALSYNGNLANAEILKEELISGGEKFKSSTDTEVILKYLQRPGNISLEERILNFASRAIGSYSLAILEKNGELERLVAVRDSHGFMPLTLGKIGDSYLVASETRAFDVVDGAEYLREIHPGEIVSISNDGLRSEYLPFKPSALCVFQYVYFSMPDSFVFGQDSGVVKKNLGVELAKEDAGFINMIKESGNSGDYIVTSIPDSGNVGALGYAQQSGLSFEFGIARDHYVGRTFIDDQHFNRNLGVKLKLNPVEGFVKGKKVIVVDDSIVRGTTIVRHVNMLRNKGAVEVHVRIFSPPYANPCFYGIDTPSWDELAAANMGVDGIRQAIGADSLKYLSLEGLLRATANNGNRYCTACFTGNYPTDIFVTRETQAKRESVFQMSGFHHSV